MVKEMSELELELSDKLDEKRRVKEASIGEALDLRIREKAEALLEGKLESSYWTERPGQFSDRNNLIMDGIKIELTPPDWNTPCILRIYKETKIVNNSFLSRASLLKVIKKEKVSSYLVYENRFKRTGPKVRNFGDRSELMKGEIREEEITRHIRPDKLNEGLNWHVFLQQQYEDLLEKQQERKLPAMIYELRSTIDHLNENFY